MNFGRFCCAILCILTGIILTVIVVGCFCWKSDEEDCNAEERTRLIIIVGSASFAIIAMIFCIYCATQKCRCKTKVEVQNEQTELLAKTTGNSINYVYNCRGESDSIRIRSNNFLNLK